VRRLESLYFVPQTPEGHATWPRLAAVFQASAAAWCPGWDLRIRQWPAPAHRPGARASSYLANTYKLEGWAQAVAGAEDGDELVLTDADMLVTGAVDAIWDHAFDVAYTERPDCRVPLNAGVVFVRVSAASRRFLALWLEENARMFDSAAEFAPWRHKYIGLNQAALGKVLETRGADHQAQVLAVPCATWNCENESWVHFDETTRIVHIKDNLRQACFRQGPTPPGCDAIVARWRAIDREVRRA
jgi:hypothetical protein